jgi:hypothetical protein
MNKEKLKHLPFALFWNLIPTLILVGVLINFSNWNTFVVLYIVINFYAISVTNTIQNDYVEEKLKQLKEQKANK